jgi:hypothetical protein
MVSISSFKPRQRFHAWSLLIAFASAGWLSLADPSQAFAQTKAPGCDSARAIGHVKRVTGSASNVTIERAQGGVKRLPAPLTPICAADRVKVRGTGEVTLDLYGGAPVVVTRAASWTAPTVRSQASVAGNVWAYFVDKLAPDIGRVQTQHRTRGPASGPPAALVAGVRTNTAKLYMDDLPDQIVIPINAWAEGYKGLLMPVGESGELVPGTLLSLASGGQEVGPTLSFPRESLKPGRYALIVQSLIDPIATPPDQPLFLGQIEIVAGKAPTLQTVGTASPYDPATQAALQALWLAQTNPAEHALMGYQLSRNAPETGLTREMVQRLVLAYGRP